MTRLARRIAVLSAAAMLLSACATVSGASNAQPLDIYAAGPTQSDMRTLFGDSNWWQGPPSFGVRPLDSNYAAATVRFSITQRFIHLGTAELMNVLYTVYARTTSATTRMSDVQAGFGTTVTSPKEGDQVLYYAFQGSGAAPFLTRTYVRLGQVVAEVAWARKDGYPTVNQMARVAAKVVDGLKKATGGKVHRTLPTPVPSALPPPGLDITLVGSAQLPIEAWMVMDGIAIPAPLVKFLQDQGVTDFAFGDYALNDDTHMEVRTALLTFNTATNATDWISTYSSGQPDQAGVANAYIPVAGGSPASGEYHYFFISGTHGGMLVCKPTVDGEAATRACEGPMERTAVAWKISLGG